MLNRLLLSIRDILQPQLLVHFFRRRTVVVPLGDPRKAHGWVLHAWLLEVEPDSVLAVLLAELVGQVAALALSPAVAE